MYLLLFIHAKPRPFFYIRKIQFRTEKKITRPSRSCFAAAPNRVDRDICLTNPNQTEKLCRRVDMASYEATQSSHQSITSEDFRSCTASENVQLPSSDVIICTNRRRRTTTGGWPTQGTTCRAWTNGSTDSSASAS